MAVSRRLRYEILRRDNHACRYCGATAPDVKLTVDHVVPSALGGSDDPTNLVTACAGCNGGKSASTPDAALVADVEQKAAQWGQAMQVAIELRAAELAEERSRTAAFDKAWQAWGDQPREGNWKNSITRFLAAGLDDRFLADAIDTAMGNRKIPGREVWRYFCGICWREIDKIREMTAAVLEPAEPQVPQIPETWIHAMRFLGYADGYMHDLLQAVGVPSEIREAATQGLWAGAEEAERAFRAGPGEWDTVEDRASESFSNGTAWFEHKVQEYGRSTGLVPDGS